VILHRFLPIWSLRGPHHVTATPHDINRFRIAALSLDDYAAGLVYMAGLDHDDGQSAYDLFKDYPHPRPEEVTADASGFIALTPEGMAGTSQDPPEGAKVSYEEVPNKGKTSAENLRVG
jgi:hypothetical protein